MSTTTCRAMKALEAVLLENCTIARVRDDEAHAYLLHDEDSEDLANHIKHELQRNGFRVFTTNDDVQSGWSVLNGMSQLIGKSQKVIAIVSKGYLQHINVKCHLFLAHSKNISEKKKVTIPLLHGVEPREVPSYIKEVNYIRTSENLFWEKLIKALTVEMPLSTLIETTDIAEALAWCFYYHYLLIILPKLEALMQDKYKDSGMPYLSKMILLAPYSGQAKKLHEVHSSFILAEPLEIKESIACFVDRDYSIAIYRVNDPDSGKEYLVPLEYIASLHTLYEMEMGQIAGLNTDQKQKEVKDFVDILRGILSHSNHCEQVEILSFDDQSGEYDEHGLTSLVVQCIQGNLNIEKGAQTKN